MALKFGKRTLFISLFAVLATLCMALSICFLLPTSSASATGNDHDHSSWTAINESTLITSSGTYYLTKNIYSPIKVINDSEYSIDVTVCLNGKTLNGAKDSDSAFKIMAYLITLGYSGIMAESPIMIGEYVNFTLCDCQGDGRVIGGSGVYCGGGVYVSTGSTFNMYGGNIEYNTASYGGGVFVAYGATFNMYGGSISHNTASYGGGVYLARHSTCNLSSGEISNNTAKISGGGMVVCPNSTVTMSGGSIKSNTSKKGYGGGVHIGASSTFTMNGGSIESNVVKKHDGGGVYVYGDSTGVGEFIMHGGTISNNTAKDTHLGGGVCVYGGTLTMYGGKIIQNNALWGGGVWMWGGAFNMYGGEITANYVRGTTMDYNGGGVWISGGTFNMYGGCIDDNTHVLSGKQAKTFYDGLYISSDGYFYMYGGYIGDYVYTDNIKRLSDSSTVTLTNNIEAADSTSYNLTYNVLLIAGTVLQIIYDYLSKPNNLDNVTLIYSKSAPIYTSSDKVNVVVKDSMDDGETHTHNNITFDETITTVDTLTAVGTGSYYLTSSVVNLDTINISKGAIVYLCLNGCTINGKYSSNSVITVSSGGTLYLYDCQGTGKITGGDVSSNTSDAAGGGVNVKGTFTMYGGTISGNTAMYGGGVSVYTGGTFNMFSGTISGNTATSNGGGVEVYGGTFNMYGGTISDNTASSGNGGGVCVDNQGKLLTTGGTLTISKYTDSTGTAKTSGGTIKDNTAGVNGGGVYVDYKCKTTMSAGTISENIAKA